MKPVDISRVNMRGLERLFHELDNGAGSRNDRIREFCRRFPSELAALRRQAGVRPVAVNGSTNRGLKMGYFMTPLRDGTHGYFQRRLDDCLQAAIASCLQVSPHLVPDLQIEKQLCAGKEPEEIERVIAEKMRPWTRKHAVRFTSHSSLPVSERRWIGVVSGDGDGFYDHCLLMDRRECLFDGAALLPSGKGRPVTEYDVTDIEYGLTIKRR